MDNFLNSDESQPWGFCQHNPDTQPCPHCQAIFKYTPAFRQKQLLQKVKTPGVHPLALRREPIPLEVLDQLDRLLEQAIQLMADGKEPLILPPTMWDAILILRNTDMRLSELGYLKAPSQANHSSCLEQDANGCWYLSILGPKRILNQDDRILIPTGSGVVEAVHRQEQRIAGVPDPLGEQSLFRGLAITIAIPRALRKLAAHLTYEGQPYVIRVHQFRNMNVLNPLSHLLHHTSALPLTMYYLHDYRPSLDIEQN
ncbi:MAG TPA: hypothetical protein VFV38_13665 [Ktedonobacteraceae bacterium]|nr:hypothetical protein [Ktedonobacteraceae bacterium]